MNSDNIVCTTELCFYCHAYRLGKKRQVSTSTFDKHQQTIQFQDQPGNSLPPELTYPETNEQGKCYWLDITFRVTNKLNAVDRMASGWRGAELFQPKLQWVVQPIGSWTTSDLHTSTAANLSLKPETTTGIRTSCKETLKPFSVWGTAIRSHHQ